MKIAKPSTVKRLLSGNEAIALGAWEAGVRYASAYPGTPSTEIMPALAQYAGVRAEWASNEKVALDNAIGACFSGARAPEKLAPTALSSATFSLDAHSARTPAYWASAGMISVLGVPG